MSDHEKHDHDHGLAHDLPRLLGRRSVLLGLGGIAGMAATSANAQALSCFATAPETQGPFPANGSPSRRSETAFNVLSEQGVIRSDVRTSFAGMSGEAEGAPFTLHLDLVDVNAGCAGLEGLAVYIWMCDAEGRYSLYEIEDQNYLRGVGITDAQGRVSFTSIFPGCYSNRWPHIHFQVFESAEAALSGQDSLLIAQVALPRAECEATYASASVYAPSVPNLSRQTFERDMIWRDNSDAEREQIMLKMTGDVVSGYTGTTQIGLAL
ncbi:dioxygenase family protein [Flavimaricola marinus]|uniref:Dioxygenase n=1 Tax=Flavimaricola marinus TaxID=1819565 RepID=A0A238LDG3_9RHOB|nr:hypothetical protein [Flavimaricola marinus]SMY07757.1 Dioxygenase [Flavimaricola marinus]